MKGVIFAAVILAISFGVDCRKIQYEKELHSRMTRSLNELWTDSITKADFKEAGEICASKNMRLATPTSIKESSVLIEFIKSITPKDGKGKYWAFGKKEDKEGALVYKVWYDEGVFRSYVDSAQTFEDRHLGGKDIFEAQKELFICEKL